MRLRRETGDWTIKVKTLTFDLDKNRVSLTFENAYLPKGLTSEDFVGAIVESPAYDMKSIPASPTPLDGVMRTTVTDAVDINGLAYSTVFMLSKMLAETEVYYDRRTGKISTDSADFDPVEPDEGDEVLFTIASETGEDITPNALDTGLGSEYFIGKKVKTDKGTYTITEDMIDSLDGIVIRYKGTPGFKPSIAYDANVGSVTHTPAAGLG